MNRLWIQLSAVFALAVIVAVLTIGISTRLSFNANLQAVVNNLTRSASVVDMIRDVYVQTGDLHDAAMAIETLGLLYIEESQTGLHYLLLDEGGNVVHVSQAQIDDSLHVSPLNELPIQVEGQLIGTLLVRYVSPPSLLTVLDLDGPRSPRGYLPIFLFVVVVIGLASGILVARTLTAPLEDLANAVRRFNASPETRVEPTGSAEMREVAMAFNEMADAVEDSRRLRRQLVADVAHELRTPLNQIQGALYAILDGIYPMTKEEITRLLEHTQNLTHIVNDLRETAQAEAGQLPMSLADIDLNTLLADALAEFRQTAQEKGVQLRLLAQTTVVIHVDRDRMLQVLRNLLSNAIRHTPPQGQITLKTDVGADTLTLVI
ncbi:MAG: histidine kinase dimerization/phospho-acceptor domain-containing protein, partial [Chloroflexota bacterium]